MMQRRAVALGILVALAAVIGCALIGAVPMPIAVLWGEGTALERSIFFQLRLPRECLAFGVGAALALSGLVFQVLFQNCLATPYTLGVSNGAAFAISLSYLIGFQIAEGRALFSMGGALLTIVAVSGIARLVSGTMSVAMLLAGVVMNFLFASLTVFVQYLSDYSQMVRTTRWLMGSIEALPHTTIAWFVGVVILSLLIVWSCHRELDLLAFGEDFALSRGVSTSRVIWVFFLVCSLLVGLVVSLCGPIGFIGVIAPFIVRLACNSPARVLIPMSALTGGVLLVICDCIGRVLIEPYEIPAGVITAIVGAPVFLVLLMTRPAGTLGR